MSTKNQTSLRLRQLLSSFDNSDNPNDVVKESILFLKGLGDTTDTLSTFHSKLCTAMVKRVVGGSKESSELLHLLGPAQALRVVYTTISHAM